MRPADSSPMRHLVPLLFVALAFAGCADAAEPVQEGPDVEVTSTTAAIRGIVVDESILPVPDVTITLNDGQNTVTDAEGIFTFSKLDPGTYFVVAQRLGYEEIQTSVQAVAGIETPELVRIQMITVAGFNPYLENLKFDGFYECAFAMWFITDSCDFAVRTAHDAGLSVVPRGIQNNVNTEFYDMLPSGQTLIQEGYFDTSDVPNFRFSVAASPIDNACDCSSVYMAHISDNGYSIGRLDKGDTPWPDPGDEGSLEYAVRGFIPFQEGLTDVATGFNVDFTILTTVFHGYTAPEGWNFEEADSFPAP